MNLPDYMVVVCDVSGKVLHGIDETQAHSILELINETDVEKIKGIIQKVLDDIPNTEMRKIRLINGQYYYLHLEKSKEGLIFYFSRRECDENTKDIFWNTVVKRYSYRLHRCTAVMESVSKIIENMFYKNRSTLNDVLEQLCAALSLEEALLLFKNGKDHILYCTESQYKYKAEYLDLETDYDPSRYAKDEDTLIQRKYEETFLSEFVNKEKKGGTVYILKIQLGGKQVGYLEFTAQPNIHLVQPELDLIKSLSSIISYIINNKLEKAEMENYIKEKLHFQ